MSRNASNSVIFSGANLLLGFFLATQLSGCGLVPLIKATLDERGSIAPTAEVAIVVPPAQQVEVTKVADGFALMALFSKVVYRHDQKNVTERDAKNCAYADPDPSFGMPHTVGNGKPGSASHWERWTPKKRNIQPCDNDNGFSYETYIHRREDGYPIEAVIAFRGTQNDYIPVQLENWESNFSNAFEDPPIEYSKARMAIPTLIEQLIEETREIHPKLPIYLTGHSLGGGIAQEIAYLDRRVAAVYAFNPSPVTNWTHLQREEDKEEKACREKLPSRTDGISDAAKQCLDIIIQNPDPLIYRIYQRREGLSYVRLIECGHVI